MSRPVPYIDPSRPKPRLRPLKAWKHMQNLIADKEDTKEVFYIIEALNGNSLRKGFDRFCSTENGLRLLKERRYLPDILDNHETLLTYPENSVAQAYVRFMRREGLSAAGLVAESEAHESSIRVFDDDLHWFGNRLRDTHDLFHVLTGYGRDALGEDALLGYTHSQHGGFGVSFISFMGAREVAKYAPKGVSISAVVKEARRNGKAAQRIVDQDIPELLKEPIDEARARMNIAEPILYKAALKRFQEEGVDPQLVAA